MRLFALAALGAGVVATGCQKGTYLELVFEGAGLPAVHHLNVTLIQDRNQSYAAGSLPDDLDGASGAINFPVSAAFQLKDLPNGTPLTIAVDAISLTGGLVAHATKPTTIMHAKTWTETLDLAAGLVGVGSDASAGDAGAPDVLVGDDASPSDAMAVSDAADDGRSLIHVTDGSLEAGPGSCVAVSLEASDSASVDYNNSGPAMDAGNKLWAVLSPQERFIGWAKFGLKFVPNVGNFKITKATLTLTLTQATVGVPLVQVRYSKSDGWTRNKAAPDMVSIDEPMSEASPLGGLGAAVTVGYVLNVKDHDWAADVVDGNVTLGVENVTQLTTAVTTSRAEFVGVSQPGEVGRPTLDLEVCRP